MSGRTPTRERWAELAQGLEIPGQALVDGQARGSETGETFACVSPIDGRTLGEMAACGPGDVDAAVAGARAAFEAGSWSRARPERRKKVLLRLAELLRRDREKLALLETLDTGKPISESYRVDVPAAAMYLQWFAEAIDKVFGEVAPTGPEALAMVTREPVGVVGAVVPWNFPLILAVWKIGPALATGNSVVLKPAEQSSLTAIELGRLALEAGLPPGVLQVVPGLGEVAGRALGEHMDVDAVSFTGSTQVGKLFLEYAGRSNMKRVALECGGKSAQIVTAACPDLDAACQAVAWGIFYNQGEVCHAGSRLLVEESIADEVLAGVAKVAAGIQPGDPLDPATKMGALISKVQLDGVLGHIADAERAGAQRFLGGEQVRKESGGFYVEPTVFDGVDPSSRLAREEVFGPVLAATRFADLDQAVRLANDSTYGLAAAIWTRDLGDAHRVARRLRAGTVWVNTYDQTSPAVPFGGFKQSGIGRDKSLHALDEFCELKTTWVHLG